jgi:hypothetical protein
MIGVSIPSYKNAAKKETDVMIGVSIPRNKNAAKKEIDALKYNTCDFYSACEM